MSIDLTFRDTEHGRASYHSYANLINVVHAELQLLERMSTPESGLRPVIRLCEIAARAFRQRQVAEEYLEALTEFRSRILRELSRVPIQPRYERDAAEARTILDQVLPDAELRVQELIARHMLRRPLKRWSSRDAESLISAIAPKADVVISGELAVPHGTLDALARLAAEIAGGDARISGGESADGSSVIELHAGSPASPADFPVGPPPSFEEAGVQRPLPALFALLYYLVATNGTITANPAGNPLLRLAVSAGV
jgi:hypothetical protein